MIAAVVDLSAFARYLSVPYPIVLVVGGAVMGCVPGVPEVHLNPAVVLVIFLSPLLCGSSIFANVNDFRVNPADAHQQSLSASSALNATPSYACAATRRAYPEGPSVPRLA